MDYSVESVSKTDKRMNLAIDKLLKEEEILRDENLEYTCMIGDEFGKPIATGSCFANTLRCLAVDKRYQGQGLLNLLIRHLIEYQLNRGNMHLFIYTKNRESAVFKDLGFYEIARVDGMLSFLENKKSGFSDYIKKLKKESPISDMEGKSAGAVVMNANPFTLGHQFLLEEAAKRCDFLHLFIVSEDSSLFPFSLRQELIKRGTSHIKNIVCHESGPYMISHNTFPSYFLKEKTVICEAHAKLDINLFEKIAKELGITYRFVGEEKSSSVTAVYNRVMLESLSKGAVKGVEIPRKKVGADIISASRVRQYIHEGELENVRRYVPESTWEYLISPEAKDLIKSIKEAENVVHY